MYTGILIYSFVKIGVYYIIKKKKPIQRGSLVYGFESL